MPPQGQMPVYPYGYMPQQSPYLQNPYMMPPMGYLPYGYPQPQQPKQINVQKAEFPSFTYPTAPVVPAGNQILLLTGVEHSERCTLRPVMPPSWAAEKGTGAANGVRSRIPVPDGENGVLSAWARP